MISLQELNQHNYPTDDLINKNLTILLDKINQVRTAWNKPMVVTSGLRSNTQQQELIKQGKSTASKSHHLTGEAVDIFDSDGSLKAWINNNIPLMETIGFWFEDFGSTPNWVHFQIVPPASGKRFFLP